MSIPNPFQSITIGQQNAGAGEPLYTAFTKINSNFSNAYTVLNGLSSGIAAITISSSDLTALRVNLLAGFTSSIPIGAAYQLTDGILANKIVMWNGEAFSTVFESMTIANKQSTSAIATRTSNSIDDHDFFIMDQITIPGFLLGPNSKIRINALFSTDNVCPVGTKYFGVMFGRPTTNAGYNAYATLPTYNLDSGVIAPTWEFRNGGTLNSQIWINSVSNAPDTSDNVPYNTMLLDTTYDFYLRLLCFWDSISTLTSTIYLNGYTVELLP